MSDRPNSKLAREQRRASLRARAAAATEHISPQVSRTGSGSSHFDASRKTLPDARSVSPGLGASFGSASMVSAQETLNESQVDRDTQRKIALERAEMLLKMELPNKPLDSREHSAVRNSEHTDKSQDDMPFTVTSANEQSKHTNPDESATAITEKTASEEETTDKADEESATLTKRAEEEAAAGTDAKGAKDESTTDANKPKEAAAAAAADVGLLL